MKSAVLGDNVKSIGNYAFSGCSNLTNLDLGDSLVTIGDYAFESMGSNVNTGLNVVFPNTLSTIGEYAFKTSGISSITIPNNVTKIGEYCFQHNTKLKKVTMGNGCRELPEGIFSGCSALTSVVLNDGLEKISNNAFSWCESLESISIPGTVVQIGTTYNDAKNVSYLLPFYYCRALKSVRFEDGEQGLVLGAAYYDGSQYDSKALFSDCPLEEVYIGRNISYQEYSSGFSFDSHPEAYAYSAFYKRTKLTKAVISTSVTAIPKYLFYKCIKLTVAKLGKSLTAVPARAFKDCIALSEMRVPATVKSIGDEAFYNDYTLAVVSMQEGLETIGNRVFYNNRGILEFSIPGTVTSIGQNSFYGCTNTSVMAFEDGEGVLTIDTKNTRSAKTDALNNSSYEDRKNDYFYDCPIEYLYLGRDLKYDYSDETSIYDFVDNTWKRVYRASAPFANSTTLEEVEIGPKVTFVYNNLCHNCDKLTSMVFPAGIQSIYDYAFANCDNLISTAFSVGLQGIYTSAFANCPKLASTTFEESSDHTLGIYTSAFWYCVSLENVTFPGQLSYLGNSAYSRCEKLKSVIFNKNEQYKPSLEIGDHTFNKCYLIKELTFPGRLESIGNYTFASCVNLAHVSFEDANTAVKLGYGASTDYNQNYSEKLSLFGNSNLTSLYNSQKNTLVSRLTVLEYQHC